MKRYAFGMVALMLLLMQHGCAFVNMPLFTPMQALQEKELEGKGAAKILLLDLSGLISDAKKTSMLGATQEVSSVALIKETLQKAERDKEIAGVIVRIKSPGGTVTASDNIYHELTQYRKRTGVRLMAYIMETGASGGYYVASAADEIMANPTAITGSIGVLALKLNIQELMAKIGVASEIVKSGDKKDLWSPFRPSTPEEREIMQAIINQFQKRFVDVVAEGRKAKLTREEVVKLADGRIYSADQALNLKLIDRTGYLDDAIAVMKKSLKIEEARVIAYVRPGSYRGTIYAGAPNLSPQVINLININGDAFAALPEVHFMYLWNP